MFDAWYNKMMKTGCKFDLGMTDTDSFLFKVSDPVKFFKKFNPFMDYSNYDENHEKFNKENKAKLGFFKDELCGKFICHEFIGLRSKCYALNFLIERKIDHFPARVANTYLHKSGSDIYNIHSLWNTKVYSKRLEN